MDFQQQRRFVHSVKSGELPITSRIYTNSGELTALNLCIERDDFQSAEQLVQVDDDPKSLQSSILLLTNKELDMREKNLLRKIVHTKLANQYSFSEKEIKSLFFDQFLPIQDYCLLLNQVSSDKLSSLFVKILCGDSMFDKINVLRIFLFQGLDLHLSNYTEKEAKIIMNAFIRNKQIISQLLNLGYHADWGLQNAIEVGNLIIVKLLLHHGANFKRMIQNHCLLHSPFQNFIYYSFYTKSNIIETSIYLLERKLMLDNETKVFIRNLFFQEELISPIHSVRKDLHIIQQFNEKLLQQEKQDLQQLQDFHDIFTLQNIMKNPVRISSGKIYESSSLKRYLFEQYMNDKDLVCPLTKLPIQEVDLLKIGNDKKTIEKYKKVILTHGQTQ